MPEDAADLLEPPKSPINDPGAHDLESSESEDHFSDAQTDQGSRSIPNSPIPVTRVEKVDSEPSYGEVPGTDAWKKREGDAEPDEVAIVPEKDDGLKVKTSRRPSTPGDRPIPTTVIEKVDPDTPSHGEVPGTDAHEMRKADAVPDMVIKSSPSGSRSGSRSSSISRLRAGSTPGDRPIPITRIERVDDKPSYGEEPGTDAYNMREEDAVPDEVEIVGDVPGSPTSSPRSQEVNSPHQVAIPKTSLPPLHYDEEEDGDLNGSDVNNDDAGEEEFGDDFDDFEEGDDDGEFDDFEDGFQEPEAAAPPPPQQTEQVSIPVLNFETLTASDDIMTATIPYVDAMFPADTIDISSLPTPLATPANTPFLSDRSASLWAQLVAPPPLAPPNWIRSRIRRLFLVSLGVPVDLDEILPASKQKKLILPSTLLSPNSSASPRSSAQLSRLKGEGNNTSSTSVDSSGAPKPSKSKRRGPPPPPELDLVSARQLCSMTDIALQGLDDTELKTHVEKLQEMENKAEEVLEYWVGMTDKVLAEREAFEGVIENLVKHARKVRK